MENLYQYLSIIFFIFLTTKLLTRRKQNLPPSPFSLPIIGHLHLLKPPLFKSLTTLLSKYGPIVYLRVGSWRILVINSSSAVDECFSKNDIAFANRPPTMAGDFLNYNGLSYVWAPYGPLWRNLRRINVVEVLSSINVQKYASIREDEVGYLIRRLFEVSGSTSRRVDMKYLFGLMTMNVMLKVVSGEGAARDKEEEDKVFQEFKSLFFPALGINLCDFFPVLRSIGFQGIEKKMKELERGRDEYLQKVVDGIRSNRSRAMKGEGNNSSMIEKYMSFQDKDPEFFTDNVIKGTAQVT